MSRENNFAEYQLRIVNRALSLLMSNYDEYDLDELMYTGAELEAEIDLIREKIDVSPEP